MGPLRWDTGHQEAATDLRREVDMVREEDIEVVRHHLAGMEEEGADTAHLRVCEDLLCQEDHHRPHLHPHPVMQTMDFTQAELQ